MRVFYLHTLVVGIQQKFFLLTLDDIHLSER